jgi:hypothetical protein
MRFAPLVLLAACESSWEVVSGGDCWDCISERPFFLDADGDGWGELGSTGLLLVQPDVASGFTSFNNRDCDDADADVTGLIGSICPERLTLGGADYTGIVYETELVAVHAESALVTGAAAADACGPWGWGGGLALLADTTDLALLGDALGAEPEWTGWVGAVADGGGGWIWEDGRAFGAPFRLCDGTSGSEDGDRLALVKQGGGWCFGVPESGEAHLVCERELPVPWHYAMDDVE